MSEETMATSEETMATSEEVSEVQVPDDHRDEVKLLPEDQQPFDYCEVDRRVQSVFFHHDIKKEIAWQFFEYVGNTLLSYKIIDVNTEKGRELFQNATAEIDNSIEVEKLRLAVRRLGREDPFAALPKHRLCQQCNCPKRNGRAEDGGTLKKSRREENSLNGGGGAERERPERGPKFKEGDLRYYASTEEDGKPTYQVSVELPPVKPFVRKLDLAPGYARRLRIISSPKAIDDKILRDICCRFGDWIRIYQSGRYAVDGKSTAFSEFTTVEAAKTCKDMLDGQTVEGNLLEFQMETPGEIEQKNKRFGHKNSKRGKMGHGGNTGPVEPLMMGGLGGGFGGGDGGYGFGGTGYGQGGW